ERQLLPGRELRPRRAVPPPRGVHPPAARIPRRRHSCGSLSVGRARKDSGVFAEKRERAKARKGAKMSVPGFTKRVIGEMENEVGGSQMNTFFTVGDINRDGRPDLVVSGRNGRMAWFENPGDAERPWQRHRVDEIENLECGGLTHDLTGDGYPDIINGSDYRADSLYWWENPG